jgi:hypothetical protein
MVVSFLISELCRLYFDTSRRSAKYRLFPDMLSPNPFDSSYAHQHTLFALSLYWCSYKEHNRIYSSNNVRVGLRFITSLVTLGEILASYSLSDSALSSVHSRLYHQSWPIAESARSLSLRLLFTFEASFSRSLLAMTLALLGLETFSAKNVAPLLSRQAQTHGDYMVASRTEPLIHSHNAPIFDLVGPAQPRIHILSCYNCLLDGEGSLIKFASTTPLLIRFKIFCWIDQLKYQTVEKPVYWMNMYRPFEAV